MFESEGDCPLHLALVCNAAERPTIGKVVMRNILLEIVEPVEHNRKERISIQRRRFISLFKRDEIRRC